MKPRPRQVFIEDVNNKCLSNDYLSECIEAYLGRGGWAAAAGPEQADVIVVTGCNVIELNPDIFRRWADFARAHPDKTVLASGCVPVLGADLPSNFRLLPYGRLVREPALLSAAVGGDTPFELLPADDVLPERVPWWSAAGVDTEDLCYLRISDGCLSACAYCAIRKAKGSVASVDPDRLMREFEAGLERGARRFWLITDDSGAWGKDLGLDLSDLLGRMRARDPQARVFLYGLNPTHLLRLFPKIEPLLDIVCFLLLPIQSGNDRVLGAMRRAYSIGDVLPLVDRIKRAHPSMYVTTEVIVGFPGETRAEFEDSLRAARHFDAAYFSPMTVFPDTPAASLPDRVPKAEIGRRRALAAELGRRLDTHRVLDMGVAFPKEPGQAPASEEPTAVVWVRR